MMRMTGLEPARTLCPLEPESSASANSATSAYAIDLLDYLTTNSPFCQLLFQNSHYGEENTKKICCDSFPFPFCLLSYFHSVSCHSNPHKPEWIFSFHLCVHVFLFFTVSSFNAQIEESQDMKTHILTLLFFMFCMFCLLF